VEEYRWLVGRIVSNGVGHVRNLLQIQVPLGGVDTLRDLGLVHKSSGNEHQLIIARLVATGHPLEAAMRKISTSTCKRAKRRARPC
jgi:hypothetical protein